MTWQGPVSSIHTSAFHGSTERRRKSSLLPVIVLGICVVVLAGSIAPAQTNWVDVLSNSLLFYKTSYPTENWDPYEQQLTLVRGAVSRGDQRMVRVEMTKWFQMLRHRDHRITDVAADELLNFALLVTPLQEFGISVPLSSRRHER
jgi:hypothetical protein